MVVHVLPTDGFDAPGEAPLAAGMIMTATPGDVAQREQTFMGWGAAGTLFCFGQDQEVADEEWPGWQAGDTAIYKLNALARSLTVHLMRTGQSYYTDQHFPSFVAAPAAGGWRICICTHAKNTSVSVSVPNRVERSLVE